MKTLTDFLIVAVRAITIGALAITVGALPFLMLATQLFTVLKFQF